MDTPVIITLTAEDIAAAQRLTALAAFRDPKTIRRLTVIWAACALFMLGLFALADLKGWELARAAAVFAALAAFSVGAFPLLLTYFLGPRAALRNFQQNNALQEAVAFSWSDAGLKVVAETGNSLTPWPYFLKLRENDAVMLLHHTDLAYRCIPKRALTGAQADDIRRRMPAA